MSSMGLFVSIRVHSVNGSPDCVNVIFHPPDGQKLANHAIFHSQWTEKWFSHCYFLSTWTLIAMLQWHIVKKKIVTAEKSTVVKAVCHLHQQLTRLCAWTENSPGRILLCVISSYHKISSVPWQCIDLPLCDVFAVPSRDWSVYRELASTVEAVIHCSRQESFVTQDLETALKKFRPDFISLLQNPVIVYYLYHIMTLLFILVHNMVNNTVTHHA